MTPPLPPSPIGDPANVLSFGTEQNLPSGSHNSVTPLFANALADKAANAALRRFTVVRAAQPSNAPTPISKIPSAHEKSCRWSQP